MPGIESVKPFIFEENLQVMTATIRINATDLSEQLIDSLKTMFGNKEIEINVTEALDETEYIFSSEVGKKILDQRMKNADEGNNLVDVTIDDLHKMMGNG